MVLHLFGARLGGSATSCHFCAKSWLLLFWGVRFTPLIVRGFGVILTHLWDPKSAPTYWHSVVKKRNEHREKWS